jgi:2OG-Fe(II) oxygenase superfamily
MPLLEATRAGVTVRDRAGLAALRAEFERDHVVRLRGLLDHDLLETVRTLIAKGRFSTREDAGIAVELCLEAGRALDLVTFVMNAPQVREAVAIVTGNAQTSIIAGRIYRFDPAVPHHDSWHDDASAGTRLIGFSVNLGAPFEGGEFQIRRKNDDRVVTIANIGAGDAILFAIGSEFEHRVRPVHGTTPKTAFAGWFVAAEADIWSALA